MIKSVFFKYILAFLVIITISFVILASVISSAIIQNSIDDKKLSMATAANIARQSVESGFNNSDFGSFTEYVKSSRSNISKSLIAYSNLTEDSLILITDLDGNILVTTPLPPNYLVKNYLTAATMNAILNQNEVGWFQTLDGIFYTPHYIFSQPLTLESGEIYGVLFFCSVSAVEKSFVNRIISTIIVNCLWVLVASMVILYFITEKIMSPVRAMSKAAKSFALGRFDVRIPVKVTKDEIGELAAAFNNMAAALAVNEETQRSFLANVSHDLRTPMTTISGFVNSILDGTIPPERQEEYLKIVSAETERLSRLVSKLYDITRRQAGEKKCSKKKFDICERARLVIISMGNKIDDKHIEVEFDCDYENMYVFADPDDIHQVLQNLLENAVKFTPEKGLIRIKISDEKDKEKKVLVSVYNTGIGIPADDIPYIFDRFYKSDRSRGLDKTGVGLGLSIVKTIIDAHEEKIWVNSEYGKYCEFTFTLQKIHETNIKYRI